MQTTTNNEKVVKQIFLNKQSSRCGPYLDKYIKIDDETNCGMKFGNSNAKYTSMWLIQYAWVVDPKQDGYLGALIHIWSKWVS